MKSRDLIADWLKGFAILLMVYGHIVHVGSLSSLQLNFVEFIYTFHMPLFLIISGFFFRIAINQELESVKKVISRLFLPYLIFTSLYLLGLILIKKAGIHTSNLPPETMVDFFDALFLHPKGSYWFIHALIKIQLCFILSSLICSKFKLNESVLVCLAVVLLSFLCESDFIKAWVISYYVIGLALNRISSRLPESFLIGLIMLLIIAISFASERYSFSLVQISWCISMLTFLSGMARFFEKNLIGSLFSWLGRNSLPILVLHAMFIVSCKPLANKLLNIEETGLFYSVLVLILTIAGSLGTVFFLDKIKLTKFFFGLDTIYSAYYPFKNS